MKQYKIPPILRTDIEYANYHYFSDTSRAKKLLKTKSRVHIVADIVDYISHLKY